MEAALWSLGVVGLALSSLLGSSVLRDRGVDAALCRRLAAVTGGTAYLMAVLRLDAWLAIALATAMACLIVMLRVGFTRYLRGVSGPRGERAFGEATFAVAGAASLAIGWGLLGDRWLGFIPIAFMAWGDNAAGLVRDRMTRGRDTSPWPSLAMFAVCAAFGALYQPHWAGLAAAVAATAVERIHWTSHPLWDDNWTIPAASLATLLGLISSSGIEPLAQPR